MIVNTYKYIILNTQMCLLPKLNSIIIYYAYVLNILCDQWFYRGDKKIIFAMNNAEILLKAIIMGMS